MAGFGAVGSLFKGMGDMASLGKRRKRSVGPPNVKPAPRRRRKRRGLGKLTGTVARPGTQKRSKSPKVTIAN